MNVLVPILADIEDVIGFVVFVVIMLLGAAGQLMNKVKEAKQKAAGPRQVRPRQPQRPPQKGPLAGEIEDFVRKAAQRRAGGDARPGQLPPPERVPIRPVSQTATEMPMELELLEPVVEVESVTEHVGSHVGRHAGDETLGKVALRHVSSRVELVDEKIESRMRGVFDHEISSLKSTSGESASETEVQEAGLPADRIGPLPSTAAAGLMAMFANPGNIRQAILINEVLQRPEHRWS